MGEPERWSSGDHVVLRYLRRTTGLPGNGWPAIVAEDRDAAVVPGVAAHGHERAGGVRREVVHERRHERHRVGEVGPEEGLHLLPLPDGGEARRSLVRPEAGAREAPVAVGQGDHHEAAPGPDVQGLLGDPEPAVRCGRDHELFVPVLQHLDTLADTTRGDELLP